MKTLNFFLTFFTILYPFILVFADEFTIFIIAILAILWILKFIFTRQKFSLLVAIFFMLCLSLKEIKFFYPVIINSAMFLIFLFSLKTTPAITKIALLKGELNKEAMDYTRNLTIIWIWFFAINAIVCFALIFLENKNFWLFYCGVISYILIGILFFGEILYRKAVLKV